MRRRIYIDPELQFPIILSIIFLVTIQGLYVGWGFTRAIAIARQWQDPGQSAAFFKALALTIVPVVLANFLAGAWLSHKIAGPLVQLRRLMGEVRQGNLDAEARLRTGDLLHAHAHEFNLMIQAVRQFIEEDRACASEADALLKECSEWLSNSRDIPAEAKAQAKKRVDDARASLNPIRRRSRRETASAAL